MPYLTIQQTHQKINVKELINKLKNKDIWMRLLSHRELQKILIADLLYIYRRIDVYISEV